VSNASTQLLHHVEMFLLGYGVVLLVAEDDSILYHDDDYGSIMTSATIMAPSLEVVTAAYILNAVELLCHLIHRVEATSWLCRCHIYVLE
jgi:hypothetical protein